MGVNVPLFAPKVTGGNLSESKITMSLRGKPIMGAIAKFRVGTPTSCNSLSLEIHP